VGQTVVVSITTMAEHPDNPLSANKDFTTVIGQLNAQPLGVFYMNATAAWAFVDQMMQMAPPNVQQGWPQIRDTLGLAGIKMIAGTCGFDGKNWSSQCMIAAPQPRSGALATAMSTVPLNDNLINLIPQSSTMAGGGSFDVAAFVSGILNLVQQFNPDIAGQVQQAITQANQMLGMDIQKDFFGSFGTQWAYYDDPTAMGNGLMGLTIINHPKDSAQLQASLEKIEGFANTMLQQQLQQAHVTIAFRQTTVNGAAIHYLATPLFSPAWAIRDGSWYWGLFPDVVAVAMKRPAGGPSIRDNPAYQQVMKELGGPTQFQSFTFADLPKTIPLTYQALVMVSRLYGGLGDLAGMESPAILLPPLDVLEAQTEPAGAISWVDDAGFHAKSIAPFPGAQGLAAGDSLGPMMMGQSAMMATAIILPSLNRARATANHVKSASNMRQIGQAILLYSNDNHGAYPPDLGTLIKTEDIGGEAFIDPAGSNHLSSDWANMSPDDKAKWVNDNADYVYLGAGMKIGVDPSTIVAYEKSDNKGAGKNMLFGDGHVEFRNLAQSREAIEASGKTAGGGL
jgi:prepilin-type processing-associated H-X9-DG protein